MEKTGGGGGTGSTDCLPSRSAVNTNGEGGAFTRPGPLPRMDGWAVKSQVEKMTQAKAVAGSPSLPDTDAQNTALPLASR